MKKTILLLTSLLLVLVLSACGGNAAAEADSAIVSGDSPPAETNNDIPFELPIEMTLMLGTVKLDDTAYAVDAQQAAELLPLWKALRSLSESETAAQAEIEAVISQITDSMTTEQMQAIAEMNLTMQEMVDVAEMLGIEIGGFGSNRGDITPERTCRCCR